jgi:hypothetical protein
LKGLLARLTEYAESRHDPWEPAAIAILSKSRCEAGAERATRSWNSMRLWHLLVFILAFSLILTIVRDQVGRIALIVFVTALGEVIVGTTAVLALFQTIGSLGEAKGLFAHAEAVATTTLVVIIGTTIMSSVLFVGAWLIQVTIP